MAKILKYGDPDDEDIRAMNKPHPMIPIDPLSLTIVPVPPNSKQELIEVISKSSNPILPLQVRRICDMDIAEPFKIVLEKRGIAFPEDDIDKVRENLRPIVKKLKYYFNRPRPAQVAEQLGIIFVYDDLASAKSPSYPSGHTLAAYVLAGTLARMFPQAMEEIYTSAEMIALSRIEAGVHFPSDNLYSMLLAEEILNVMF